MTETHKTGMKYTHRYIFPFIGFSKLPIFPVLLISSECSTRDKFSVAITSTEDAEGSNCEIQGSASTSYTVVKLPT